MANRRTATTAATTVYAPSELGWSGHPGGRWLPASATCPVDVFGAHLTAWPAGEAGRSVKP